jgi:hypothetical protein
MKKAKTNILVVGLLATGSSALVDLLREYEDIHVIQNEFNDFRAPGLVADQLGNLEDNEYLNEIGKLTTLKHRLRLIYSIFPILRWETGTIKGIKSRFKFNSLRIRQLRALKKLNSKLISTISDKEKKDYANQWIQEIGDINNPNKKFVLFDQPLLTAIKTRIWKEVFYPFKLIIVYRDPKDQLAEIIKNGKLYGFFGAPNVNLCGVILETIYGRSRKAAITIHTESIKKRFEWIDSLQNELETDNFLLVDFEGLVNNYDVYKNVIRNFIGNSGQYQTKPKVYFDPKNATKSIGLYSEYLNNDELEIIADLEKWYSNALKENQIKIENYHRDTETV